MYCKTLKVHKTVHVTYSVFEDRNEVLAARILYFGLRDLMSFLSSKNGIEHSFVFFKCLFEIINRGIIFSSLQYNILDIFHIQQEIKAPTTKFLWIHHQLC